MKYMSFKFKKFKGIRDAIVKLDGPRGSIYTLVGLNESGKTTVLEAINYFRTDDQGVHALTQKTASGSSLATIVPKDKKANFNDKIEIEAVIRIEPHDITAIQDYCRKELNSTLDVTSLPKDLNVTRSIQYENSAHKSSGASWKLNIKTKKGRAKHFITCPPEDWQQIVRFVAGRLPRVVYFPTFLFDFPEKILISEDGEAPQGNEYLKMIVEDALASLDQPLDLQKHIIDRITDFEQGASFSTFVSAWTASDEKERVDHCLYQLQRKIGQEIFSRWQQILGESARGKELLIGLDIQDAGNNTRAVYLTFHVKERDSKYKISERSLGFRWFFCFLLFTRFMRNRNNTAGTIFLFDEPASNLHSRAQSKLLDSLEKIAGEGNDIIYTTHSHHLINPLWLEYTYVIANNSAPESDLEVSDKAMDVQAIRYRTFVGQNEEKSHYFQPILDRLDYRPAPLEGVRSGVIVEGKSDFYILNWYKKYFKPDLKFEIIPVGGSSNAAPLLSLYLGWSKAFVILLDSDTAGIDAGKRYLDSLPISPHRVTFIGSAFDGDKKIKEIEDLISDSVKSDIAQHFGTKKASKTQILRAFSESLMGTNLIAADKVMLERLDQLTQHLEIKVAQ